MGSRSSRGGRAPARRRGRERRLASGRCPVDRPCSVEGYRWSARNAVAGRYHCPTVEWTPAGAKRGTGSGVAGKGRTVHGEATNAGHRVLAPDDAEVEAYLETALHAPGPERAATDHPAGERQGLVAVIDFSSQFAPLIARRVRALYVYSDITRNATS